MNNKMLTVAAVHKQESTSSPCIQNDTIAERAQLQPFSLQRLHYKQVLRMLPAINFLTKFMD